MRKNLRISYYHWRVGCETERMCVEDVRNIIIVSDEKPVYHSRVESRESRVSRVERVESQESRVERELRFKHSDVKLVHTQCLNAP